MRQIAFGRPIIGEEERSAVLEVLSQPILVHGPRGREFESAFAQWVGGGWAVAVSSCTAALHLAYFDLGIGPGDEVIVPAQTHNATAHAVEFTGARPVFVDAEPRTGNLDLELLEAAVTPRTRAISLVHFLGVPVDMERVNAVAGRHGLFVVEDCALALGTRLDGVHTGLWGDVGCFSFYPVKHMTTAEGGMFLTKHEDLAGRIARKRAFGVDRTVGERQVPGVYDVTMLGYNYRMSEIQAALGLAQLDRMEGFLAARERNFQALEAGLRTIDEIELFDSGGPGARSSRYCLSIRLGDRLAPKRFELVGALKAQGVGTSVYYPRPVPHLSYYAHKYGYGPDSFPVAAAISHRSVALPVGPHLSVEDMDYITEALKRAIVEVGQ